MGFAKLSSGVIAVSMTVENVIFDVKIYRLHSAS